MEFSCSYLEDYLAAREVEMYGVIQVDSYGIDSDSDFRLSRRNGGR